jgi:hypothetical protein
VNHVRHVFDPEAEPQAQTRREALRLASCPREARGSSVASLRAPFDAREAALQAQMACHEQAGKALDRKLSPRVEWWPQPDLNRCLRLERAFQTDLGTLTHVSN